MKALFLLLALAPLTCLADGYQISGVKSDLPMNDADPHYRDFYVNMGLNQGIKKGSQLEAYRTLSTVDDVNQRVGKSISFKVAKLKVIHADDEIAVARLVSMEPADSTPVAVYPGPMVGDRIELGHK